MKKELLKEGYVSQLRNLLEAEVNEAEVIIAVKGIGKSIQEMTEKIGRLQNEDIPPLSDQVRETYGVNTATEFQQSTTLALQNVMDALHAAKQSVDKTVLTMAGSGGDDMVDVDMDANIEVAPAGDEFGLGDEFADIEAEDDLGLGDEFADIEEPLGRATKESVQATKRKIAEMARMVSKAKKLRA